eukprot:TRINITY_DN9374_c1_g1_i2.p1 TRINITY_DN9374_c1_g1~~TRINITY_DN9374_c1_g1_i2.p1  ORF type:complete len:557 (-),score=65.84 TRINITY_DN9374_c1_g1_i2:55-1725(-)
MFSRLHLLRTCSQNPVVRLMILPQTRPLTFVVPGLHPVEQKYLETQVNLIVNHDFTKKESQRDVMKECGQNHGFCPKTYQNYLDRLFYKRIQAVMDVCEISTREQTRPVFKLLEGKRSKSGLCWSKMVYSYMADFMITAHINNNKIELNIPAATYIQMSKHIVRDMYRSNDTNPISDFSRHEILEKSLASSQAKQYYKKWVNVKEDREVNMARNIYILSEMFQFDLSKVQRLETLKNIRAMEVLVQLNVMDKLIMKDNLNKQELMQNQLPFLFYPVVGDRFKWIDIEMNQVALFAKLLASIGCDDLCIQSVLYFPNKLMVLFYLHLMEIYRTEFDRDFELAQQVLKERWILLHQILKKDEDYSMSEVAKVGLIFSCDLVAESKQPDFILRNTVKSFKFNYLYKNYCSKDSIIVFLREFDEHWGEAAFRALKPFMERKQVELPQELTANLSVLQAAGVSNAMIAEGGAVVLATYQPGRVLEMVKKLCQGSYEDFPPGVGPNWRTEEKAFRLLAYHLEAQEHFPIAINFRQLLVKHPHYNNDINVFRSTILFKALTEY